MDDTVLVLTGLGVVPYSARGLREDLRPIDAGSLRRTVNGDLIDVTSLLHRKYLLGLVGSDQEPPALDSAWRGLQVVVDAVTRLAYLTGGSAGRTVVPGSSYTVDGFTVYRPRLTMLIVDWSQEIDEWGATLSWSLSMEET